MPIPTEEHMKLALIFAAMLAVVIPASRQQEVGNSFGKLSERTISSLIVALEEAQQRGALSVDVNDLVIGLIIEDQEPYATELFEATPPGVLFPPGLAPTGERTYKPFFPPRVTIDMLVKLSEILPRSNSIPHGTEMQTSAAYDRVIAVANNLPSQFHQSEVLVHTKMVQAVVPLDLLAAALREPCEATKMLQEAGITEERVLQTIRAGGDLENGTAVDQAADPASR
jgi:hypothetical protein